MAKKIYSDDDLIMISGIQHYAFCPRQWALIHVERQWAENVKTTEGHFLHERVDDPNEREKRKDTITIRAVSLVSYELGLYGIADVVEYHRTSEVKGIILENQTGRWIPFPVEYKLGEPKPDNRDEVQLCAQAMCLEEMHRITISDGALFYGKTRRRVNVSFTPMLKDAVKEFAATMHLLVEKGETPRPVYMPHCKSCSLVNICMPKELDSRKSVRSYLKSNLEIE